MWRRTTLATLHKELETLALFDRIHEYAPDSNPDKDRAYADRQMRRSQIMAEIERRRAPKLAFWDPALISSAVVVLCAVGYATVHYLLK